MRRVVVAPQMEVEMVGEIMHVVSFSITWDIVSVKIVGRRGSEVEGE